MHAHLFCLMYKKVKWSDLNYFYEPQALRQLKRIPKRSHPCHNSRRELYHNKRGSFIPQLKRNPTLPQLERSLQTTAREESKPQLERSVNKNIS